MKTIVLCQRKGGAGKTALAEMFLEEAIEK